MISNRRQILQDMKTLLQGITTANGFQTTVQQVKRGAYGFDQMMARPALCYYSPVASTVEFAMSGKSQRTLNVVIRGFVDIQGEEDFDNLDKLIADVEKALMTPSLWSYQPWTKVGTLQVWEDMLSDAVAIFELTAQVSYDYDWASP